MNNLKASRTIKLTGVNKPFLDRSEILKMYYKDIRNSELLTQEETKALFQKYQNGTEEEKLDARNKIFEHNARLVTSLARQYCASGDVLMDLIQEGNIGLLNAIDKFDLSKESSFQSCALFYIRREINLYRTNYSSPVKQTNRSKTDNVLSNITAKFVQKENRNPTIDEMLELYNEERTDKPISDKNDLVNVEYVYIDNLVAQDGELNDCRSFMDFSNKTCSLNDCLKNSEDESNKAAIEYLMSDLSEKEKTVIEMYYGITGDAEESFSMIADRLCCSSERVRQLCKSALSKMQKKSEQKSLSL